MKEINLKEKTKKDFLTKG